MRELYDGPLEPGMVMVGLGNEGEPFRRDLVLGRHPFKEGMVIFEAALPCKMRKRLGSGVGEIGLCPEINMRLIMRPEEAVDAPAPDASARPGVLTGEEWLEPGYWEKSADVEALELGALLRRGLVVAAEITVGVDGGIAAVFVELRNGRSSENWMLRLTAEGDGALTARVRHA